MNGTKEKQNEQQKKHKLATNKTSTDSLNIYKRLSHDLQILSMVKYLGD
jgi:hypothetical protein